jgi:hypothetical protein
VSSARARRRSYGSARQWCPHDARRACVLRACPRRALGADARGRDAGRPRAGIEVRAARAPLARCVRAARHSCPVVSRAVPTSAPRRGLRPAHHRSARGPRGGGRGRRSPAARASRSRDAPRSVVRAGRWRRIHARWPRRASGCAQRVTALASAPRSGIDGSLAARWSALSSGARSEERWP